MLGNSNETYNVIGVVKDYHFASLTEKIAPQLFTMKLVIIWNLLYQNKTQHGNSKFKMDTKNISAVLSDEILIHTCLKTMKTGSNMLMLKNGNRLFCSVLY